MNPVQDKSQDHRADVSPGGLAAGHHRRCRARAGAAHVKASTLSAYKIVTAFERGTYIQIGRDLAKFVAPQAQIELEALPSVGSPENIHRLRYEEGVKLALVQSDVYQAFINQGKAGDKIAESTIRPLRVVLPLCNEEVYFFVRADSPMKFAHEIRNSKITVGPTRSGAALTATTMYRLIFATWADAAL